MTEKEDCEAIFDEIVKNSEREVKMEEGIIKIEGKIARATGMREHEGKNQIGFTLENAPSVWYNITEPDDVLSKLVKIVKKSAKVEFHFEALGRIVKNFVVKEKAMESENWSDNIVPYEDLLKAAHKKGIKEVRTEMIQVDFEKKIALFKAIVIGAKNMVFEGHGDATPENVKSETIQPHFVRMAETRAKARAMRDYVNDPRCADIETAEADLPKEG